MIRIVVGNRVIGINFSHTVENVPITLSKRKRREREALLREGKIKAIGVTEQRRTTCDIVQVLDYTDKKKPKVRPIVDATVKTYYRDKFQRADGRREALLHCFDKLQKAGFTNQDRFTRAERELIWNEYFKCCPIPTTTNAKKVTRNVREWLSKWCEKLPVEAIEELKEAARVRG